MSRRKDIQWAIALLALLYAVASILVMRWEQAHPPVCVDNTGTAVAVHFCHPEETP